MSSPLPRKLLLINPNTSASTTERLVHTLGPLMPEGWQLQAQTARFGASYISCGQSCGGGACGAGGLG